MEPGLLGAEIARTRELTDRPFAVNLITIAPNCKRQLDVALQDRVPFIIFAGSFPRKSEIQKAKERGAKVMAFAPTEALAKHLIRSGVDALILEGSEAGGHIGQVSLGILLQQVLLKVHEVPVFVAGGIATGAYIAHLLLMGAAGVQLGTYFVLTEECGVHPRFKEVFIRAQARDAVATPQVGPELKVIAVRALRNKGLEVSSRCKSTSSAKGKGKRSRMRRPSSRSNNSGSGRSEGRQGRGRRMRFADGRPERRPRRPRPAAQGGLIASRRWHGGRAGARPGKAYGTFMMSRSLLIRTQ